MAYSSAPGVVPGLGVLTAPPGREEVVDVTGAVAS